MPLYDYKCLKCAQIFEVKQRITEEPLKHCPKCNGQLKRIISPAGIIFKGSGFHITDYAKKHSPTAGHAGQVETKKSAISGEKAKEKKEIPSKGKK
jgi:putative FmdB family regulatory protein